MKIRKKQRTTYLTSDDQEFIDKDKAFAHERTLATISLMSDIGIGGLAPEEYEAIGENLSQFVSMAEDVIVLRQAVEREEDQ